ncbi:MAG: hypothetical protein ACI4QA_03580 [Candidatus Spyradosoma sp.]
MEISTEEHPRQKSSARRGNARWTGVAVFVVAVVAVLIYVSSQEHDAVTLALLCLVLLAGEIFAALQWHAESRRLAAEEAAGPLLEAFDRRMRQSFANQEIIHKEVHDDFEALSARLAALERALADAAKNRPETRGDLDEISDEIEKLNERLAALAEEFSERLEAHTQRVQERVEAAKTPAPDLKPLRESLDAVAETQDEILEKLDALFAARADENEEDDGFETDELLADEADDADAFPLPENMLERAREANAATAASAAAKLIADVPAKADEAPATVVVIEYFPEAEKPAATADETPESAPGARPEPTETSVPAEPRRRPVAEGELPLIEDLPHTALILKAAFGVGERPYLRGKAPGLSLKKSVPMDYAGSNLWRFDFGPMREDVEITIFRNDTNEALDKPFRLRAGKVTTLAFSPNA